MPKIPKPLVEACNTAESILFEIDKSKGLAVKLGKKSNNLNAVYTSQNVKNLRQLRDSPGNIHNFTPILSICHALEILHKHRPSYVTPVVIDVLFSARAAADGFASLIVTFQLLDPPTSSMQGSFNQFVFNRLIELVRREPFELAHREPETALEQYHRMHNMPSVTSDRPLLHCINSLFSVVFARINHQLVTRNNLNICLRSGEQTKVVYFIMHHMSEINRSLICQNIFNLLMSIDLSALHSNRDRCIAIADAINLITTHRLPLDQALFVELCRSPWPANRAIEIIHQAIAAGLIVAAPVNMGQGLHDAETTPWEVIRANLLSGRLSVTKFFSDGVKTRDYDGAGDGHGGAHGAEAIETAKKASKILKRFSDKAKSMTALELDSVITSIILKVTKLPDDALQTRRKCKFALDRLLRDNEYDPRAEIRARELLIASWLYLNNPANPANEAEIEAFMNSLVNYIGKVERGGADGYDTSVELSYSIGVFKHDPEMRDISGLDPMCYARLRNLACEILAIEIARRPGSDGVIRRIIPVAPLPPSAPIIPKAGNQNIKEVSDAISMVNILISVAKTIKYNQATKEALSTLLESLFVNTEENELLTSLLDGTSFSVDKIIEVVGALMAKIPELKIQFGRAPTSRTPLPPNNIVLFEKIALFERRMETLLQMPIGMQLQAGTVDSIIEPVLNPAVHGSFRGSLLSSRYQPPSVAPGGRAGYSLGRGAPFYAHVGESMGATDADWPVHCVP